VDTTELTTSCSGGSPPWPVVVEDAAVVGGAAGVAPAAPGAAWGPAGARLEAGAPDGTALLAAGTDGRDGPTDAAGAIVDARTWSAIEAAGRDPARDLARHDAYHALDAAGALLRPGLTGTNVMDVVIGITDS